MEIWTFDLRKYSHSSEKRIVMGYRFLRMHKDSAGVPTETFAEYGLLGAYAHNDPYQILSVCYLALLSVIYVQNPHPHSSGVWRYFI